MLKKRLIFTLLYSDGAFMLSRNFRLQRVGDIDWLERNYVFSNISSAVDEIVLLNVARDEPRTERFIDALGRLAETCFVPIAAGGWVRDSDGARDLLRGGADKVVVNTPLFAEPALVEELAATFGAQCVVAAVDVSHQPGLGPQDAGTVRVEGGRVALEGTAAEWLARVAALPIGDLYLNSIDRDGTGQGYDLGMLDLLPSGSAAPVIIAGGAGNSTHLDAGLRDPRVDAVATAHLLNFVGDGLLRARANLLAAGLPLPVRDRDVRDLRNVLVTETSG